MPSGERERSARPGLQDRPDARVTTSWSSDPNVSRRHAEIRPVGIGFVVVDLGSTNGTGSTGPSSPSTPSTAGTRSPSAARRSASRRPGGTPRRQEGARVPENLLGLLKILSARPSSTCSSLRVLWAVWSEVRAVRPQTEPGGRPPAAERAVAHAPAPARGRRGAPGVPRQLVIEMPPDRWGQPLRAERPGADRSAGPAAATWRSRSTQLRLECCTPRVFDRDGARRTSRTSARRTAPSSTATGSRRQCSSGPATVSRSVPPSWRRRDDRAVAGWPPRGLGPLPTGERIDTATPGEHQLVPLRRGRGPA